MGLLKGSMTFTRYRVQGKLPPAFPDFVNRQIKAQAFREMGAGEEKSCGWTSLENVLDTAFEFANYDQGDYLAFCLRLDRRVIPSSLLRLKLLEAEKKTLAGRRAGVLRRAEREEIKERVRLELLRQTPPVPSFVDLCWSVSQNWLLFGSLAHKVVEEFEPFFKKTFQLTLTPWLPWDPRQLDPSLAEKISSLGKGVFLAPQEAGGERDPSFLGREFLSWLWFKSEERGGAVHLPGTGDVEVNFVRRLVLESGDGEYAESVVCQGRHADLKEGKAAIREGKRVREARLQVGRETEKWELTLKADQFQFQSLRLPQTLDPAAEEEAMEGRLLERIYLVERALKTLDGLFSAFLERRLSPKWLAEEIPRLKKWAQR